MIPICPRHGRLLERRKRLTGPAEPGVIRVVAQHWIRHHLNGIKRRLFSFRFIFMVESHLLSTTYMRRRSAKPDSENTSPLFHQLIYLSLILHWPFRLRRFPSVEGRARRGAYLGH